MPRVGAGFSLALPYTPWHYVDRPFRGTGALTATDEIRTGRSGRGRAALAVGINLTGTGCLPFRFTVSE
ncbi:hypothetical protein GCM10009680_56120 [Streptomyces yatensis]|uniref:Uncharacterized protein n=1 Tax=Streptomyces yatensis TaxID=155177 RepID=A0ABN2IMN3_9ACTN